MRYPEESWDLDYDNDEYVLAYEAFEEFKISSLIKHTQFRMLIKKFSNLCIRYTVLI